MSRRLWLIITKELRTYFLTPQFYVIAGVFSLLMGWIFFNLLVTYLESVHNHLANQSNIDFSAGVLRPFFSNMNFLFVLITPILTMRTLAGEQERGTLDLLMSSTVRPWELVIGKWFSSLLSGATLILLSFFIPLILVLSSIPLGEYLLAGYLALFCNLTLYISLGLFFSSITRNQNVAALTTLVGIIFLWMIPWAAQTSHNLLIIELLQFLGVMTHFNRILGGLVHLSDFSYYLTSSALVLCLSIIFLVKRRKYV